MMKVIRRVVEKSAERRFSKATLFRTDCASSSNFSYNSWSLICHIANNIMFLSEHSIFALRYVWAYFLFLTNKRNLFFDVNCWIPPRQPWLHLHYYWHHLSHPTLLELPASLVALSIDVKSLTIMSCGELGGALTTIPEANHRRFNARVLLDADT